jgi:hypothetical protein
MLRGERNASDLEALQTAGVGIYQELGRAEQERAQLVATERDLWTAPPSLGAHLLATWNAFVLQSLAAGLLDADPGTVGYVPQVTFDVSGEELAEGGPFVRRIVLGPFQPTSEVDYCDPEGGHHDD